MVLAFTAALLLATTAFAADGIPAAAADCWTAKKHGQIDQAHSCFEKLTTRSRPSERAEGFWGLGQFNDANVQFREATAAEPGNAELKIRWALLLHERFNDADANSLLGEALEASKDNPRALYALALIASDGFENKAVELAKKAIEVDPKYVDAQELLARLSLEDSNKDGAVTEAEKALKLSPDALDAMSVLASVQVLRDKSPDEWTAKFLKVNPHCGECYSTMAHFLIINRRYTDGIEYYRKALAIEPDLDEARSQLGVNLMRTGKEEEARAMLEKAYADGYRDAATANSLTLLDSYKRFVTFTTPTTIIKVNKKEADVLHPYVEEVLKSAIATYEKKYHMKLNGPVQVEVYPDHEDFAVRTMGLPGLGALGVTFGQVIAMDSPSGRPPGQFHWAGTLWHEMSHVYVLTATNHRVPRWFTEGLAVYEETATNPDWGDRLDPGAIKAIKEKKLLPIAELDRGFIRPSYPNQVVISYFQGGKICEFIAQKWGYEKLVDMIHAFAKTTSTPEVIESTLGVKPEKFDEQFNAWLTAQTKKTVDNFDTWKTKVQEMAKASLAGNNDEVIKIGKEVRDLYPDFVEHGSVYELMAKAYLAKGDTNSALEQLQAYSKIGGRNPQTIKQLADLLDKAGKPKEAAAALERLIYIYPIDADLHQRLGDLAMKNGDSKTAVREYQVLIAAKPLDVATAHYDLARALRASNKNDEARDQVLLSLEAAPGYKPAQKMLLELAK